MTYELAILIAPISPITVDFDLTVLRIIDCLLACEMTSRIVPPVPFLLERRL
jgi:hypothetical protein